MFVDIQLEPDLTLYLNTTAPYATWHLEFDAYDSVAKPTVDYVQDAISRLVYKRQDKATIISIGFLRSARLGATSI